MSQAFLKSNTSSAWKVSEKLQRIMNCIVEEVKKITIEYNIKLIKCIKTNISGFSKYVII